MCANCGYPLTKGHWTDAGYASAHDRLRARIDRARLLQGILPQFGVVAQEPTAVDGLVLSSRSGASEIATDLSALWDSAERLGRMVIDPLDPRFTGEADDGNGGA